MAGPRRRLPPRRKVSTFSTYRRTVAATATAKNNNTTASHRRRRLGFSCGRSTKECSTLVAGSPRRPRRRFPNGPVLALVGPLGLARGPLIRRPPGGCPARCLLSGANGRCDRQSLVWLLVRSRRWLRQRGEGSSRQPHRCRRIRRSECVRSQRANLAQRGRVNADRLVVADVAEIAGSPSMRRRPSHRPGPRPRHRHRRPRHHAAPQQAAQVWPRPTRESP